MRAVVQRVSEAGVRVEGAVVGAVGAGLLVLLGVGQEDTDATAAQMAGKIARMRVFEDAGGKMNRSVLDTGGSVLAVSQFTLLADTRKGNRPSFVGAARPGRAEPIFDHFCAELSGQGVPVERGVFGAHMAVRLCNDGPVTIVVDL